MRARTLTVAHEQRTRTAQRGRLCERAATGYSAGCMGPLLPWATTMAEAARDCLFVHLPSRPHLGPIAVRRAQVHSYSEASVRKMLALEPAAHSARPVRGGDVTAVQRLSNGYPTAV